MPSSSGGIRVNPNGQTAVVTFTLPNGGTPVAYSSKSGSGTVSLPATVTTETTFWFQEQTTFTVSALVGTQQSASSAGTTAAVDLSGGGVAGLTVAVVASGGSFVAFHAPDGTSPLIAKAAGNGKNGVIDWTNDDTMGYLLHLHAGPNSTTSAATIGIGTDQGHGGGILIAHKNDNFGLKIDGHPGSAIGAYLTEYGGGTPLWVDLYAGAGDVKIRARNGAGFNDGVATSGSTTFTSASAAFTGADVGVAITQLTSKGAGDPFGGIPAGTTIASVTNATTVVLSQPATASGTGILFLVAGRTMAATQSLFEFIDTDGSTVLAQVKRGSSVWNTPSVFTTNDIAQPAIKATGKSGQTSDIAQVLISGNGTPAWNVQASGKVVGAFGSYSSNAGQTTQSAGFFQQFSTSASVPAVGIKGVASQAGAQLDVQDSSGVTQSKFDKVGRFVTAVASAPVLGDLIDGQTALSHDASGNLIITSRIGGALKTATVTVA